LPPLADAIAARAAGRAGDTLSVWGWAPEYNVETGLMPATRDAIGHYVISESPPRNYFRNRYLNDLAKNRPALFIDAVSEKNFHWTWSLDQTHESFPELDKFIEDNYALWQSIPETNQVRQGRPVRIYVLKERLPALEHIPTNWNISTNPVFEAP